VNGHLARVRDNDRFLRQTAQILDGQGTSQGQE